jgi:hypothetical protein
MPFKAFQDIGDRLTTALISGDYALYQTLFRLPLVILPRGGAPIVLANEDDLRADFDLYRQSLVQQGITDIFRDVNAVEMLGPDSAEISMLTHIMQRAHRIVDPIPARFTLIRVDGVWLIQKVESSASHINWTMGLASLTAHGTFE